MFQPRWFSRKVHPDAQIVRSSRRCVYMRRGLFASVRGWSPRSHGQPNCSNQSFQQDYSTPASRNHHGHQSCRSAHLSDKTKVTAASPDTDVHTESPCRPQSSSTISVVSTDPAPSLHQTMSVAALKTPALHKLAHPLVASLMVASSCIAFILLGRQVGPVIPAYTQCAPVASFTLRSTPGQVLPLASVTSKTAVPVLEAADFAEYSRYKLLQLFSLPTWGKVLALMLVAMPIVTLGGYLYKLAANCTWPEAMQRAYFVLNDVPGADITQEDGKGGLVLNTLYVLSIFTFAVLVGIFTEDISQAVESLRNGNFRIPERNHTVILGWNRHSLQLLKQISAAQQERAPGCFRTPVIVLADADKEVLDARIADELGERAAAAVVTRTGSPTNVLDLQRVAAGTAHTVLVLTPDSEDSQADPDSYQAMTLMALRAVTQQAQASIVVQSPSGMLGSASEGVASTLAAHVLAAAPETQVTRVHGLQHLEHLVAQCALQPGLSAVFSTLLQQGKGGAEFYVQHVPHLVGKTYGEAWRAYGNATVCGVLQPELTSSTTDKELNADFAAISKPIRATGKAGAKSGPLQVVLSPVDEYIIQPGDLLVYLAEDAKAISAATHAGASSQSQLSLPANSAPTASVSRQRTTTASVPHVVVLDCSSASDGSEGPCSLLQPLEQHSPPGTHVTLVTRTPVPASQRTQLARSCPHLRLSFLQGEPTAFGTLLDAGVAGAHSVAITGISQQLSDAQADAQVVAAALQIQSILGQHAVDRQTPLNLVATIRDPNTRIVLEEVATLAAGTAAHAPAMTLDLLDPNELISGILVQVAAEPGLQLVFQELFDSAGKELKLQPLQAYGITTSAASMAWQNVQEAVRTASRHDTALGYITPAGELRLGLTAQQAVRLQAGDRLLVLAE